MSWVMWGVSILLGVGRWCTGFVGCTSPGFRVGGGFSNFCAFEMYPVWCVVVAKYAGLSVCDVLRA